MKITMEPIKAETSEAPTEQPINLGDMVWCEGCTPDNCSGCGLPYQTFDIVKRPA